jgi:hypothetical protein
MTTKRKSASLELTLTFGYHQHPEAAHDTAREECCLIKSTAEDLGLTVDEEIVDGWYFGAIKSCPACMKALVLKLVALDLAKQISLEIHHDKTALDFSHISGIGEIVFTLKGQTYIGRGTDLPEGFRPRISRARSEECEQ